MEEKNIMDVREALRAPFPPEAISQHPTKTFLSTIKAIYITERLNDVFGIGGWLHEHEIISDEPDYVTVRGRIIVGEPYNIRTPDQYGGHNKTGKNTEPADGYKSAVTDCQSKCASYFEIGIDVFKGTSDNKKAPYKDPPKKEPIKNAEQAKGAVDKPALERQLWEAMDTLTDEKKKEFFLWLTQKYEGQGVKELTMMLKDISETKVEFLGEQDVPEFDDDVPM